MTNLIKLNKLPQLKSKLIVIIFLMIPILHSCSTQKKKLNTNQYFLNSNLEENSIAIFDKKVTNFENEPDIKIGLKFKKISKREETIDKELDELSDLSELEPISIATTESTTESTTERAPSSVEKVPALLKAAEVENPRVIRELLIKGYKINFQDKDGNTALILATRNNRLNNVLYLLKAGAQKDIINNNNESALDIAKKNQHNQLIEILQ